MCVDIVCGQCINFINRTSTTVCEDALETRPRIKYFFRFFFCLEGERKLRQIPLFTNTRSTVTVTVEFRVPARSCNASAAGRSMILSPRDVSSSASTDSEFCYLYPHHFATMHIAYISQAYAKK